MPTRKDKPQDPAPKSGAKKKSKAATKPSFTIGGTLPVERKTGWVYRSEANAPPSETPAPRAEARPSAAAARTPAARPAARVASGTARNQWKSWLAEGAEALLVPFEVALVLALAPLGLRSSAGAKDRK